MIQTRRNRKITGRSDDGNRSRYARPESPVKKRIIKVAARLFAQNGYDATGVEELGQAVGLGRGSLYHHIESKETLLYEISIRHVVDMVAFAEDLVAQDLPADEKFRRLARQLVTMIAKNLPEVTVFFHEYRSLSKEHDAEMKIIRDRFEALWLDILQQGVDTGVFRPTDPILVKGILGMYNYAYVWIKPRGQHSPAEVADIFSDMALGGLTITSEPSDTGSDLGLAPGRAG